ncbi:MAG TPA: rhodanese-like domain-containing protein [Gordonia sp. (in: high G+C Gram-positive bacteria)]|uniref:rhodanese-like domain-containing protein n=1 Tax=unclassified Gordonia (in: high G+C Gram-positive bacteria) TaxID=2657482 RepID=UPI0025BBC79B|nr:MULTISPECIES: rhodanese-like domain-containing protein [unclassified Gordonia (in: high G+C Gram-positive bacteria)]HNP57687.1 rhodanese-like domain-containing protein [Gordonia sp. (in: high G+C Gram-positive bacteria)]HRC51334.1 rhodanese-like domain-containing protein [Gordonia sp. (in: high G+C Gram-positive bacteria)]
MMREITAEQAFEHAACGDAVILDVRPQVVRHQGSVPGALVVEPGELTGRLRLNPAVRHDAEVAVVALNAQADEIETRLSRLGFTKLVRIAGGFRAMRERA